MTSAAFWRLFVAIDLGSAARAAIVAAQDECRPLDLPVRWVDPAGAHLTLQFLGDTDPAFVAPIGEALRAAVAARPPFVLRTAAPGVFPNPRRPRVIWLGLDGPLDRLNRLQVEVAAALAPFGFPREARAFRPHLTLGRVREGSDAAGIATALGPAFMRIAAHTAAPLPVDAIHLIRSELRFGGARYTTLASAALGDMRR
jgi:2'-5' RNA ligase